jgi:hypothetical protein
MCAPTPNPREAYPWVIPQFLGGETTQKQSQQLRFCNCSLYFCKITPLPAGKGGRGDRERKVNRAKFEIRGDPSYSSTISPCKIGVNVKPFSPVLTRMVSPTFKLPDRTSRARGSCNSRWMARFRGRAPKSGSNPTSAK